MSGMSMVAHTKAVTNAGDAGATFGRLLRRQRERVGLSQRALAAQLGVAESTIARIEAGTRKPPRENSFYDRLREVREFTESDVEALLNSGDAPRWRYNDSSANGAGEGNDPIADVASTQGLHVEFRLHPTAELEFTEDDLDRVREILRQEMEMCLNDLVKRREAWKRQPVR